jgi:hypothetical protein
MSINVGRQVNLIGFHRDHAGDAMPARRFQPPWSVEELEACVVWGRSACPLSVNFER